MEEKHEGESRAFVGWMRGQLCKKRKQAIQETLTKTASMLYKIHFTIAHIAGIMEMPV